MKLPILKLFLVLSLGVQAAEEKRRELPDQKTWYAVSLPASYNPKLKYEVFVALQGSGDNPDNVVKFWRSVLRGRSCIIAAPKPADTGFWNLDEDDKVKATVDDLKKTYSIEESRVHLLGFSAGCAMGFGVICKHPGLFRTFGAFGHIIPEETRDEELKAAAKTSIFYSVGASDAKYVEKAKASAEKLKELKFDMTAEFPEKVGHQITLEQVKRMAAFVDEAAMKDAKKEKSK
ncbi:MAG TPA: dienelactone hydrolase family protein [Planctomycetota bacterium]|nr:dienelactone hydrolase family protein [Planctomycetota bacterium]